MLGKTLIQKLVINKKTAARESSSAAGKISRRKPPRIVTELVGSAN
jgi:hypothetical protein